MSEQAWVADDIPDQSGRLVVVTGANSGIGLETARQLACHGATVVMAVRDLGQGEAAAADIATTAIDADLELLRLDLASLASVRDAAATLRQRHPRLDVLINNAGVMYTLRDTTVDGFELQFGTNHLGHFAWTGLLLDLLLDVEGSRAVTVGSLGHRIPSRFDLDDLHAHGRHNRFTSYARSKLANLLFTYALQRRLAAAGAPTIALAAHPGGADTELARHVPGAEQLRPILGSLAQSPDMAALPSLRAATDPAATGGQYFGPDGFLQMVGHPVLVRSSRRSHDRDLQERLWAVSERSTDVTYPIGTATG